MKLSTKAVIGASAVSLLGLVVLPFAGANALETLPEAQVGAVSTLADATVDMTTIDVAGLMVPKQVVAVALALVMCAIFVIILSKSDAGLQAADVRHDKK